MATVYARGGPPQLNVPPTVGMKYWWFKNPRVLLTVTVLKTSYNPNAQTWDVELQWDHYLGLVNTTAPELSGEVAWNNHEWDAVHLKEYITPIRQEDLADDEEACGSCHGGYFETERDLEICACIWCDRNKPGTTKKRSPLPIPEQRSPLHPELPAKITT